MAWREKVRHDLVRPTTVIQRWGDDELNTFTGDKTKDGPGKIKARDFQAFQRVMPHSEYPSGSACICTAYSEFTDAFTIGYYLATLQNLTFGSAGEGQGYGCDPEMDPPIFVSHGCDHDFAIPNMQALLQDCAESRLWAGFHFTAAVTEGLKMCKGVGYKTYDHVQYLRNGSNLGDQFHRGDPRPICSDPTVFADISTNGDYSSATNSIRVSFWASLLGFVMTPMLFFSVM